MNKTRNNQTLFRSCLCGFVLTVLISVNFVFAIPSEFTKSPIFVFASSNNQDSQDENAGNDQPDGSSIEQQEQGTIGSSGDETDTTDDGSGVASEQDNACPAVAFEGPSYIGENGCPVPCPKDNQDSVPEGCPPLQQQPQQPLEQSTTPPTPTDDIAGTIQQEEGAAGLEPDESITLVPPEQIPSDQLKPLTVISEEGFCDDQIDNDGDGKTDFQDFDCNHGFGLGGPFPSEICDDGKDNDRDGATDMNDRDCFVETETQTESFYGLKIGKWPQTGELPGNLTKYKKPPADLGNIISSLTSEQGLCNDGIDNDKDGLIDTQDTNDCPPLSESRPPGFDPFGP